VRVYPFIEAEKTGRRNIVRACALLKVSRAAFYSYLSGPAQRERDDAGLTQQIQAVHEQSRGRYGAPARSCAGKPFPAGVLSAGALPADPAAAADAAL
jgi:hypothetical protein